MHLHNMTYWQEVFRDSVMLGELFLISLHINRYQSKSAAFVDVGGMNLAAKQRDLIAGRG